MVYFIIGHSLINQTQHGFLKGRSCLTNLLEFMEHISKWADDGSPVDVGQYTLIFRRHLIKCPINDHGVGESILNWVRNWLSGRNQRGVVEGD